MSNFSREVLSEHFEHRLEGRRVVSAVFLTYQFDPGFFEQEILPVFFKVRFSHVAAVRLAQLEDAIRSMPGQIAVYYDQNGLAPGDSGSAKLDIRRVPVRNRTGVFHPKNVFTLVEPEEADEDGYRPRALLAASLSANLTRAGWWENVEVCHVEQIAEGENTRMRDNIREFLAGVRHLCPPGTNHQALDDIRAFLGRETGQREHRTGNGELHTHFYSGVEPFVSFLERAAGHLLSDKYLEIVSPYFDNAVRSIPLTELIDRFRPRQVQVLLPELPDGEVGCRKDFFASVEALEPVQWARFPKEDSFFRFGKGQETSARTVHAKVYRFFSQNPKREFQFVGSVNLTTAAHGAANAEGRKGGNVESGFLVEVEIPRRPEFWLEPVKHPPAEYHHRSEDEGAATTAGSRLTLRHHWDTHAAEAWWDGGDPSPVLRIEGKGVTIVELVSLVSREWTPLDAAAAGRLEKELEATSFVSVHGDRPDPVTMLVQEDGMSHKPSILMRLSVADILRYWSLLTPEQRAEFIITHPVLGAATGEEPPSPPLPIKHDTFFDRFAGYFHAFGCIERQVRAALGDDRAEGSKLQRTLNPREAVYRLFGKKYDSLGTLLKRLAEADEPGDAVDRYVIASCARQLCKEIARDFPDFWREHHDEAVELEQAIDGVAAEFRGVLVQRAAQRDKIESFLDWFDQWFLRRAAPVAGEEES